MRLRLILAVSFLLSLGVVHQAIADGSASVDAGAQGAGSASVPALPDLVAAPGESASLLYKLYKAGHLIPALVLGAFLVLGALQPRIAWLRTGYRRLAVASALGGLAMLAERAAAGVSPSLPMIAGAVGVALALYMKGDGAAVEPAA